ncbi:MAG: precorrin-8X methylmutase [Marivibrio sp.]|uniref:precorrin-8X methylmutase n=1 Tax=Marivibrio sp. TaxID=2039719 RepID=UPI0032EF27C0
MSGYDYIRDPAEIYRESFRRIREAADLSALPETLQPLARRLIHAVGRPEVADALAWSEGALEAGRAALERGAPVLVDSKMVAAGIVRARLPAGNDVLCLLDAPGVVGTAARRGTTRSAAQVDYWRPWLDGAVVAIGNAPTALFALLEAVEAGGPKPALVLGMPVGFVGASESKHALIDAAERLGLPYVAVTGREGGSALAAAAVNALALGNPEEAGS